MILIDGVLPVPVTAAVRMQLQRKELFKNGR